MARIELGKGLEYLDKILDCTSSILSRPVKVVIMGRIDDSASKKALQELLDHNKHAYRIDYKGWADEKMKESTLPVSGVFLYPSHYDTYALVVNQALSFGLPVVVWDVPFVAMNYNRIAAVKRVPAFDIKKFAESAVGSLLNRDVLIEQALRFAFSQNTPSQAARLDTTIYESIAGRKYE